MAKARKLYRNVQAMMRVPDDNQLLEYLDCLGHGKVSPWIREALYEKMERETGKQRVPSRTPS